MWYITDAQHAEITRLAASVPEGVDDLVTTGIPHACAHAAACSPRRGHAVIRFRALAVPIVMFVVIYKRLRLPADVAEPVRPC